MKSHRLLSCVVIVLVVVCGQLAGAPAWPTKTWSISTPAAQGMNGAKLDAALAAAQKRGLALHGVVIVRHGFIVKETYFSPYVQDTGADLYSCTKSFVSALTGIAIDKGFIPGVSAPVLGFFPGAKFAKTDAGKRAMTLEDLLTMTSGLGWVEGDPAYRQMYVTRDWVKFILDFPMAATPGKSFNYSSANSHILSAIIQRTTGVNTYDFARAQLFEPLGIHEPNWERDPAGIPIGGWGLSLSPRDMAKLGYLYLHNGMWEDRQVVPAAWVRESTRPHIQISPTMKYGYQWWISAAGGWYAALGRYGQSIFVVPGLDMVVVFTAHIDSSDPEALLLENYIMPACAGGP